MRISDGSPANQPLPQGLAELELEPVAVELVLVPVLLVLGLCLPVLVLAVSLRTCFFMLSHHFTVPEDAALG